MFPQEWTGQKPDEAAKCYPSFLYFRKLKIPPAVQVSAGDVYEFTQVFDRRKGKAARWQTEHPGTPARCHLAVGAHGQVTLLKELVTHESKIRPRAKHRGGRVPAPLTITTRTWDYPAWILDVGHEEHPELGPEAWIEFVFGMTLLTYVEATDTIIIRARKDHRVAAFGIDLATARPFFRDRDKLTALARDGKRKRIFHAVAQHLRHVRADKAVEVRSHYRGLRSFDWNGYGIHIVWPDNGFALRLAVPAEVHEDPVVPRGMMTDTAVAKRLAGVLAS